MEKISKKLRKLSGKIINQKFTEKRKSVEKINIKINRKKTKALQNYKTKIKKIKTIIIRKKKNR